MRRLPRSFQGPVEAIHAGRRPPRTAPKPMLRAWDAVRKDAALAVSTSIQPPSDIGTWMKGLRMASTCFTRVRLLAEAMRQQLPAWLLEQAFTEYWIHPLSVLSANLSPSDYARLFGALADLAPELREQLHSPEWPMTALLAGHPLPANLLSQPHVKVAGSGKLQGVSLTQWPEGLEIEHHLQLSEVTGLRALPRHLHVCGDLMIERLPDLESLPEVLSVEGRLLVKATPRLRSMPRVLEVGGLVEIDP